jgi:hypothetical protein
LELSMDGTWSTLSEKTKIPMMNKKVEWRWH